MLVELGNHTPVHPGPDDRPKVTTVEIPEFDAEFRAHTNHYGHAVGELTPQQFKDHLQDALLFNQGLTRLPGHEALLAVEAGWRARGIGRPAWVSITETPGLTPDGVSADLEQFLSTYYEIPTLAGFYNDCGLEEAHVRKELEYWTRRGAPGEHLAGVPTLPDAQMTYMVDGRIMNNNNDGGDSLSAIGVMQGVGTGSTATTLTGCSGLTTNGLAGHRVYVYTTSGNVFVWGNCISNTATAITVDQWYVPATPGGSVGASPGTPWAFAVVDGGLVSTFFAALATGANAPANTDHTLATGGNVEYVQAGGTLNRKICPAATDVSASARTVTLVPVFTANGTDTLPKTFTVIGFFASMVVSYGGAGGPMKFETTLSPSSATISASGDQVTITDTISGS